MYFLNMSVKYAQELITYVTPLAAMPKDVRSVIPGSLAAGMITFVTDVRFWDVTQPVRWPGATRDNSLESPIAMRVKPARLAHMLCAIDQLTPDAPACSLARAVQHRRGSLQIDIWDNSHHVLPWFSALALGLFHILFVLFPHP